MAVKIFLELKQHQREVQEDLNGLCQAVLAQAEEFHTLQNCTTELTATTQQPADSAVQNLSRFDEKLVSCTKTLYQQMKEPEAQIGEIPTMLRSKFDKIKHEFVGLPNILTNMFEQKKKQFKEQKHQNLWVWKKQRKISYLLQGVGLETPPPHMKSRSPKPEPQEEVKEEETGVLNPDLSTKDMEERLQNTWGHSNYPKTSEYQDFEGKPDEYWVNVIDIINTLQSFYNLPDAEITSRLPSILLGVAKVWFRVTCRAHRGASWERCK